MFSFRKLWNQNPAPRTTNSNTRRRNFRPGVENLEARSLMSGTPIKGIEIMEQGQPIMQTPAMLGFTAPALTLTNIINQLNSDPPPLASITSGFVAGVNQQLNANLGSDYDVNGGASLNLPKKFNTSNVVINATPAADSSVAFDVIIKGVTGSLSVHVPQWEKDALGAAAGAATGGSLGGFLGAAFGALAGAAAGTQISDPSFNFSTNLDVRISMPRVSTLVSQSAISLFEQISAKTPSDPGLCTVTMGTQGLQLSGSNVSGAIVSLANQIVGFVHDQGVGISNSPGPNGTPSEQTLLDVQADQVALGTLVLLQQAKSDGYQFSGTHQVTIDPHTGNLEYFAAAPTWIWLDSVNKTLAVLEQNNDPNGVISFKVVKNSSQPKQDGGLEIDYDKQRIVFAPGTIHTINIGDIGGYTRHVVYLSTLPVGYKFDDMNSADFVVHRVTIVHLPLLVQVSHKKVPPHKIVTRPVAPAVQAHVTATLFDRLKVR